MSSFTRTQLTEALDAWDRGEDVGPHKKALIEAARWARDFPTVEQVEAATVAYVESWTSGRTVPERMRAALEAVTMIGKKEVADPRYDPARRGHNNEW
jgi:hypothetical protein